MAVRPICEPVGLPLGNVAHVDRVRIAADAPTVARLLHFHDVAEIVLFGTASGQFICDGESFVIAPGTTVFAPSMRYHDFQLDDGAKDWTLIQIDPYLVERLAATGGIPAPTRPFRVVPSGATRVRLAGLADWLAETAAADPADPLIERIVEILLVVLTRLPVEAGIAGGGEATSLARFLPVIEQLRRAPGDALTLHRAALLCHLSPAYFSRRFAQVFGCGFADYVTSYRLHLASRRIATTPAPLSQIGYTLGFASHSHFTARFRERFGVTPRDYRRQTLRLQNRPKPIIAA